MKLLKTVDLTEKQTINLMSVYSETERGEGNNKTRVSLGAASSPNWSKVISDRWERDTASRLGLSPEAYTLKLSTK